MFADYADQAASAAGVSGDGNGVDSRVPRVRLFAAEKRPPAVTSTIDTSMVPPAEPVVLTVRVTSAGLLLPASVLRESLRAEGLRRLRGRLTTVRKDMVGKRVVAWHKRQYFREQDLPGANGALTPVFTFARWAPLSEALLELNPTLRLSFRCRIPPGSAVAWELAPALDAVEPLFPNQELLLAHLLEAVYTEQNLRAGLAGCILVADTGFGKTYTALALARRLGRKTLVVMPNTNNFAEWDRVLRERYAVRVGSYYGPAKQDGDVVLTTIQSLTAPIVHTRGFRFADRGVVPAVEYFREFGFVIYDEVHNYATESRHEIFWELNTRAVLGLTATPDERADRLDEVYHYHVGPEVVAADLPGYHVEEIAWNCLVRVIRYSGPPQHTELVLGPLGTDTLTMNRACARDPWRLALLLYYVEQMVAKARNVFVFAEHRGFLDRLHLLMQGRFSYTYPERQITQLVGGQKATENAAGRRGDVILITYGYGAESLSLPRMDTIVLASPRRAKCKQVVGRILRRGGDPSVQRLIYDFVDVCTPMAKQFADRRRVYLQKSFALKFIEIPFSDCDQLVEEYGTRADAVQDMADAFE